MSSPGLADLSLREGRFARFERVEWWDQQRLRDAHVLVVGAGAIGNEVIKNLALLGIGHLVIADMDTIELSNLSRSVLFREADAGRPKAECAARAARDLFPDVEVESIVGNIASHLGLGYVRWADVVVGALDNREARLFINAACARVGRPWIDGGIEVLNGIVRGFAPPSTACYECTMSAIDWQDVNRRRSCSMLARRALDHGGAPTTPTTASVIGAIQAQEAVKRLHGLPSLFGRGFVFEGMMHSSYATEYRIDPDCPWHEPAPSIRALDVGLDTPLRDVCSLVASDVGGFDALELGREIVEELECVSCGARRTLLRPIESVSEEEARCTECEGDAVPKFLHSLPAGSDYLSLTPRQLGLPPWDIVWARRAGEFFGFELAADARLESGGAYEIA
jgi:molybdopterin/thiamine biosynthesis adenylyltransferase